MKILQARIIRSAGYGFIKWKRGEGKDVKFVELLYRQLYDYLCNFLTAWTSRRIGYLTIFSLDMDMADKDIKSYTTSIWYTRKYQNFLFEYWDKNTYSWKQVNWNLYETISD